MASGWLGPAFQLIQVHDTLLCGALVTIAMTAIANVATQPGPNPGKRL